MKRYLLLGLALMLVFSLTACSSGTSESISELTQTPPSVSEKPMETT